MMNSNRDTTSLVNKIFNLNLLKFKHVYGNPEKKEHCYENIKITKNANDSQFCAVNPKFLAVVTESSGGGCFIVVPIEEYGRIEVNYGRVCGHKGPVLDIKWNPFNDNIIASSSDDCTIKIWHIPDGGLGRKPLNNSIATLNEHKRRVPLIEWHPTADNILFSVGFDHLILIWHVNTEQILGTITCHTDTIQSISLNRDGSLLATTCKDKFIRVIEPRTGQVISKGKGHLGSKSSKVAFLGDTTRLLTTGFSKYSDRQWAIWSQFDLSEPLTIENIDSSSGVLFPFYDHDTKMVYIAGKGDGSIRYYELVLEPPWCHYISQFITGFPQRGLGHMPKRGLDVTKCEIFRFYKLHAMKCSVEPISMIVPRKSSLFQPDVYPDTAAPTPALSAQEWISGKNKPPILISMKNENLLKTNKSQISSKADINNDKKFIFISQDNMVDYRENNENNLPFNHFNNQNTAYNQLNLLSNSCSFNNSNLTHHSSSHSSLSNASSNNSFQLNLNSLNSGYNNGNLYNNNNSYNEANLNKWDKDDIFCEDLIQFDQHQNLFKNYNNKKQGQKKKIFRQNSEFLETNNDLNELNLVKRRIANGKLTRSSTGLIFNENKLPKNYEDLLLLYKNQLEEIRILKKLNQKKDMKIKELENQLEDFKLDES